MEAWELATGKDSLTGPYHAWFLGNVTPDPKYAQQKPRTITLVLYLQLTAIAKP